MPPTPFENRFIDAGTILGRCVFTVRRAANLSQHELAAELQITAPALSQLERGHTVPTFRLLIQLGHVLRDHAVVSDASGLLSLFEITAQRLKDEGAEVVNGPLTPGELTVDEGALDRLIGRLYDDSRAPAVKPDLWYAQADARADARYRMLPVHQVITLDGDRVHTWRRRGR